MSTTSSQLHYLIIDGIIRNGFAPDNDELAVALGTTRDKVVEELYRLQEYHGVVLHPNEAKVWVIHPFSLAPTNFYVESEKGQWWGNCAWCSLGIAALLKDDVTITTTIGAETKQIEVHILNGEIQEKHLYIHFPIPMQKAWDNVIYTCSNMLIFESENQIDQWTKTHNIPKGDVQPIDKIWKFARRWYENHLSPQWTKWTVEDAKKIFNEFGLNGTIWDLRKSNDRF